MEGIQQLWADIIDIQRRNKHPQDLCIYANHKRLQVVITEARLGCDISSICLDRLDWRPYLNFLQLLILMSITSQPSFQLTNTMFTVP